MDENENFGDQIPYPRFRDYVCHGIGQKDDQKLIGSHNYLRLEMETVDFEDSGGLTKPFFGTPLMPYSEPSFENEGKKEKTIENIAVKSPSILKKRTRKEYEMSQCAVKSI